MSKKIRHCILSTPTLPSSSLSKVMDFPALVVIQVFFYCYYYSKLFLKSLVCTEKLWKKQRNEEVTEKQAAWGSCQEIKIPTQTVGH